MPDPTGQYGPESEHFDRDEINRLLDEDTERPYPVVMVREHTATKVEMHKV